MTAEQFLSQKHGGEQVFSRSAVALLMEQYHTHKVIYQCVPDSPAADAFVPTLTYQEGYEEVREPRAGSTF